MYGGKIIYLSERNVRLRTKQTNKHFDKNYLLIIEIKWSLLYTLF